jgi:hypothetical protein
LAEYGVVGPLGLFVEDLYFFGLDYEPSKNTDGRYEERPDSGFLFHFVS